MISKILLIVSIIILILWAIGFWAYHMDSIIHINLVFAALFVVLSFSTRDKMKI
jgi:Family of unknown function (DUF5670)